MENLLEIGECCGIENAGSAIYDFTDATQCQKPAVVALFSGELDGLGLCQTLLSEASGEKFMNASGFKIMRSWLGGPLLEFSGNPHPKGNWHQFHSKDPNRQYSRHYHCDACGEAVVGVTLTSLEKQGVQDGRKWLCAACRDKLRPKQEQPASLRKKS